MLPDGLENPRLLPLLLLALLPIILHLLDRRRARTIPWPAMRFLVPKSRVRLRGLRALEALLILLRSLAVLAMVCALLRPIHWEERPGGPATREDRAMVLVLDASYSMAYREDPDGPSSLEKARDSALQVLDDLSPLSRVVVLREGAAEQALGVDEARRAVRDARLEAASFRLLPAIDRAAEALRTLPDGAAEVFVFTDLQASSLPDANPERLRFAADRLRAARRQATLRLIDCGAAEPANRFIADLEAPPLAVAAGEQVLLRAVVEASRPGTAAAPLPPAGEPLVIRLAVNGAIAEEAALPREGSGAVELGHRFLTAGPVALSVSLPPDGLAEDDARHLVLDIHDRIPVLVAGTSLDGSSPGTARYVRLALEPRAEDLPPPPSPFRTTVAMSGDEWPLTGQRVVVITGIERLEPAVAARIEAFVRSGGGLLILAGAGTDAASLADLLFREGRGVLPARLLPRSAAAPAGAPAVHPRMDSTSHPALSLFSGGEEGDLSRITVRRWTEAADPTQDAVVLARLDGGSPWIIERAAGEGRVIVVTTSAAPDDSDLPRTPLFLPLIHRLVRYLAATGDTQRTLRPGQVISVRAPAESQALEASVVDPGGASHPLERILERGEARLRFRDTRVPGIYEVRPGGGGKSAPVLFAVNLPPEESRLERLGDEALGELRAAFGLEVLREPGEARGGGVTNRVKMELWPALAALALAFLLGEGLTARALARGRAPWKDDRRAATARAREA